MVRGLQSLNKKLRRTIPERVLLLTIDAMEKSADEIVGSMKSFVPVEDGALRDSIGWTWGDIPDGAVIVARSAPNPSTGLRITIYAGDEEAFYARFVEFGTAPHNVGAGGGSRIGRIRLAVSGTGVQHPGATAQPFFFPGYRLNRKRASRRINRAMRKGIREGAKR